MVNPRSQLESAVLGAPGKLSVVSQGPGEEQREGERVKEGWEVGKRQAGSKTRVGRGKWRCGSLMCPPSVCPDSLLDPLCPCSAS